MSERKKKVIHVKDLVIKADNVFIEPARRNPPRDPFFGRPWPPRRKEAEENAESPSGEIDREEESGDDRRPPSWI